MARTFTVDLLRYAEPFETWCAARGVTRSDAMRQLVAMAMGIDRQTTMLSDTDQLTVAGHANSHGDSGVGRPCSLTLTLTHAQRGHLREQAAKAGMAVSWYVLAAVTARDSDAGAVAGKDAVQALIRSNVLLAQALFRGNGSGRSESQEKSFVRASTKAPTVLIKQLQDHLSHAAKVLADVELTRAGHLPPNRKAGVKPGAKPRGRGRRTQTLG